MENAAGGRRPDAGRSCRVTSTTHEYVRGHAEGTAPSAPNRRAGLPASSRRTRRTYEMIWCSSVPAAASIARHTLLRRLLLALERGTAAAANRRQRQPRASSSESQSSRESGQGSEHETRGSPPRAAPASSHLDVEDFRVTRHGTRRQTLRTSFSWSREVHVPARTCPRGPSTSVSQP
ncbi:uncharacterized protein LOC142588243 [Dermacentor variabilis]|uniref:uncharacterized protein LOC142588243 n=1 Tax=Dermacentor variabilis TaxID=34621 RepID=UPI003F5AF6EC